MIIGIVGKAQHGKDTFGKMLADVMFEKSGTNYILMAYATELKKRIQQDFDLSFEQLWGGGKEVPDARFSKPIRHEDDTEPYWTPREILQSYGQFFRTIDCDFWVKALFNVIDEKRYENVIITDARHPNEVNPISKRHGKVIRIIRNIETGVHNQEHISEIALDNYKTDITVHNIKDLKSLRKVAVKVADHLTGQKQIIGGQYGKEQRVEFKCR